MSQTGRIYRGIAFIRLSDLSDELRNEISSWVDETALLNIRTNEGLFRDCILTKDYEYWYKNIHAQVQSWQSTNVPVEKVLVAT